LCRRWGGITTTHKEDPSVEIAANWLAAKSLGDVAYWLRSEKTAAYEHPYGFTVIRIHRELLPGWQVRVHLWPPRPEQTARLHRNATVEQQVHSHGWHICSLVLLGALEERCFRLASDTMSTQGLYTVVSDYAAGFSRLQLQRRKVSPVETAVTVRTTSTGTYVIPRSAHHASTSAEAAWSLSLVTTELAQDFKSTVIAPESLGDAALNKRRRTDDLMQLRNLLNRHG
jgi:hypothetical protein